jgi:hypothetical protein
LGRRAVSPPERFVFVVCGGEPHRAELTRALAHLDRFAAVPALVVTDRRRTPGIDAAGAAEVVDVATDPAVDDRTAALLLKTSLPRHLPPGFLYCYLDSDVLAVKPGADQAFLYRFGDVTFAPDHCRLRAYSPHAVACGCLTEASERRAARLDGLLRRFEAETPRELVPLRRRLLAELARGEERRQHPPAWLERRRANVERRLARYRDRPLRLLFWLAAGAAPRFGLRVALDLWRRRDPDAVLLPAPGDQAAAIRAALGCEWRAEEHRYRDGAGRTVLVDIPWHVAQVSPFRFDAAAGVWTDGAGEAVFHAGCDHLRAAIAERLGVAIDEPDWQHWNGGVFLFDHRAAPFFETWNAMTRAVVADPRFRPRDQGALVAAVWRHGLQRQATLPVEFNYLADYQKPGLEIDPERGFTVDGERYVRPFFAHVYHHFGDRDWPVWRWIEAQVAPPEGRPPAVSD